MSLPDPKNSYFFRNFYAPEALHNACKKVAISYPDQPIPTIVDGDFRGKDSFSKRCVDIEAAIQDGIPAKDVLSVVDTWSPIIRRDLQPDDITPSKSIQYDDMMDAAYLDVLILGDQSNGLSVKAAKRAKHQLEKDGAPINGRVQLSDKFIQSLGPLEEVDVAAPLTSSQKVKIPSVHSTQNIWNYLEPYQQKQFAQNLQDTQAEGSYLVVGPNEVDMDHLSSLLQRHGYTPDPAFNEQIKRQSVANFRVVEELPHILNSPVEQFVYRKS